MSETEYYYRSNPRQFANHIGRALRKMINKTWPLVSEILLLKGEKEATEVEEALRFLDDVADECISLAM